MAAEKLAEGICVARQLIERLVLFPGHGEVLRLVSQTKNDALAALATLDERFQAKGGFFSVAHFTILLKPRHFRTSLLRSGPICIISKSMNTSWIAVLS